MIIGDVLRDMCRCIQQQHSSTRTSFSFVRKGAQGTCASLPAHMLLSGPPGVGKTTLLVWLARLCVLPEHRQEHLHIFNASNKRGETAMRTHIRRLATKASSGSPRVIVLDEVDHLTEGAQGHLATLLTSSLDNTLFLMTCNDPHKLSAPLVDACVHYCVEGVSKDQMVKRLTHIAQSEGFDLHSRDAHDIANECGGDMRSAIHVLQTMLQCFGAPSRSVLRQLVARPPLEKMKAIVRVCEAKAFRNKSSYVLMTACDALTHVLHLGFTHEVVCSMERLITQQAAARSTSYATSSSLAFAPTPQQNVLFTTLMLECVTKWSRMLHQGLVHALHGHAMLADCLELSQAFAADPECVMTWTSRVPHA